MSWIRDRNMYHFQKSSQTFQLSLFACRVAQKVDSDIPSNNYVSSLLASPPMATRNYNSFDFEDKSRSSGFLNDTYTESILTLMCGRQCNVFPNVSELYLPTVVLLRTRRKTQYPLLGTSFVWKMLKFIEMHHAPTRAQTGRLNSTLDSLEPRPHSKYCRSYFSKILCFELMSAPIITIFETDCSEDGLKLPGIITHDSFLLSQYIPWLNEIFTDKMFGFNPQDP